MREHLKVTLIIILLAIIIPFISTQPTFSDNCYNWNANTSVCEQCNPGFYLQYFFCVPCNPNCACSSKHDFCDYCLPLQYNGLKYGLYHHPELDQCLLCSTAMPNCLECENLQMCTKCFNGQYLVEHRDLNGVVNGRTCSANVCQANCQFCQDSIHCKECQPGFYLYLNKTCSPNPCTTNCTTCSSITKCSVCSQGFFLSNGQCLPCTANCAQCTNAVNCNQCQPEYALQNGTCTNTSLSNCVEYASGFTVCTGCEPGYEVTAGACNQCTGCELCLQQFICLTPCLPGYQQFNFACVPSFERNLLLCGWLVLILLGLIVF